MWQIKFHAQTKTTEKIIYFQTLQLSCSCFMLNCMIASILWIKIWYQVFYKCNFGLCRETHLTLPHCQRIYWPYSCYDCLLHPGDKAWTSACYLCLFIEKTLYRADKVSVISYFILNIWNWIGWQKFLKLMVVNIQFTLLLLPSWTKFLSVTVSRSFEILLLQSKNNHRWGYLVHAWFSEYLTLHWLHSDRCKDSCKLWITAVLLHSEVQILLKDWVNHTRSQSW